MADFVGWLHSTLGRKQNLDTDPLPVVLVGSSPDSGPGSLTDQGAPATDPADAWLVQGTAADGAAASGNPVLVGGVISTNAPADQTDGDAGALWLLPDRTLSVWIAKGFDPGDHGIRAYNDDVTIRPTLTTTSTPYSAGDVIGTGGAISLAAPYASGYEVELVGLDLWDNLGQSPDLTILFFRSAPAGTYADNGAPAIDAGDPALFCGGLEIKSTDWVAIAGPRSFLSLDLAKVMDPAATAVYCVILAGTVVPTYGANATSLVPTFKFRRAR